MDSRSILDRKKNILDKLSKRQIKDAFELLISLVVNVQEWRISERLSDLETNYKYLLHYQFEGVDDPQRETIYKDILRSLYEYTDDAVDELLTVESSDIFYEKIRISSIKSQMDLESIQKQLVDIDESKSLISLLEKGDNKKNQERNLAVKLERFGIELFNLIFIAPRADDKIEQEYKKLLFSTSISSREKCLFISALTLNLIHRFDKYKVSVLMDACKVEDVAVRARAIVGLIIIMQIYDDRWQLYSESQYQLDALSENDSFRRSVFLVIKQLIMSRETEKISRKMTEEIIPEMMKLSSMTGKKLNIQDLMGETDFMEKNPEWQKELKDSGIAGKLQEYSNLQMEGADVFHSTFANLKNFPFFREMSNWFLPFDISYSELLSLTNDGDDLAGLLRTAVLSSGHMCDSDKYSFALSLTQIPSGQRQMMLSQFGEQSEQIKELQKDAMALNPKVGEEIISNQYIQDLYRFFKLYSNRSGFLDIFKLRLNFYDKKSIVPLISNEEDLLSIANYCFDKNHLEEALSIYLKLLKLNTDRSNTWQKIGYCRQMLNDLNGALDAYLQAELVSPENSWVIKKIAQTYKLLKDYRHSLEYYQHASLLKPDDLGLVLNIGHCYLELEEYEKALNSYFKVEMLDTKTKKAWRPIAWTAFLLGKQDVSRVYYEKILSSNPSIHDFLNAGHVELSVGDTRRAVEFYLQSARMSDSFDVFIAMFQEDEKALLVSGLDSSYFPLLFDELRYKLEVV